MSDNRPMYKECQRIRNFEIPEHEKYDLYKLICPMSGKLRWIGVTRSLTGRLYEHFYNKDMNKEKQAWIDKLKSKKLIPKMEYIATINGKKQACEIESMMIEKYFDTIYNKRI